MQYFNDAQFGWGNMIHGCTFNTQEECMQACVDKADCKGFTYDPPPAQFTNNCFLFSKVGDTWVENNPDMVSGFKCDHRPPVMPTGRPTVDSWSNWKPPPPIATTPAPTLPPVPTCPNTGDRQICKAFGDPHFVTFDGKKFDNQGTSWRLFAQSKRDDLPKFKAAFIATNKWWWNRHVSMVGEAWIRFQSKTPGHNIVFRFYEHRRNIRSQIRKVEKKTGIGKKIDGVNEMNNGDYTYLCIRGQACVTTWFGLKFCFSTSKWGYATIQVPKCYKNNGLIGACGNWNGNPWDDQARVDKTDAIKLGKDGRKRRAAQTMQITEKNDNEVMTKAFDPDNAAETCAKDYAEVKAKCEVFRTSSILQACYDEDKVDGPSGLIANCIFDACNDPHETDYCDDYSHYVQSCMTENAGKISKGDALCGWASELGCVTECGANSSWNGCVDECADIKTCGTLSPVPKECPAEERVMKSMCSCDDGYVFMDDKCVPESECGCTTEEGAIIPIMSEFKNCDNVCTCFPGKILNCFPYNSPADVPEECKPDPEASQFYDEYDEDDKESVEEEKDPIAVLDETSSNFKRTVVDAFGKSKFGKILYAPIIRLKNRMKDAYHKFKCSNLEARGLDWGFPVGIRNGWGFPVGVRFNGPCPSLLSDLSDIMKWNREHVADCNDPNGKMTKRAKGFAKNLQKIEDKIVDKCEKKFKNPAQN